MANETKEKFRLYLSAKGELERIEWSIGERPLSTEKARFARNRVALALFILEYKVGKRAASRETTFKRQAKRDELYYSLGRSAFAKGGQVMALIETRGAGKEVETRLKTFFPSKRGDNLSDRSEIAQTVTVRIDRRRLPRKDILVFQDGKEVSELPELETLHQQLKAHWEKIPRRATYGEKTTHKIQKAMAGSVELKDVPIAYDEKPWSRTRIAESLAALRKEERKAIEAISLFPGSFTRSAVQRICGASVEVIRALEQQQWISPFDGVRPVTSRCRDEVKFALRDQRTAALERKTMMNFAAHYVEEIEHWENEYIAGGFQRSGLPRYEAEGVNVARALQWIVANADRAGRALCLKLTYIGNYLIPIRFDADFQKRLYGKGAALAKDDGKLFEYFRGQCARGWAYQSTGENKSASELYPAEEKLDFNGRRISDELKRRYGQGAKSVLAELYARAACGKAHCQVNLGHPVTACEGARRALFFAGRMSEGVLRDRMYRNIYRVLGRAELDCGHIRASRDGFEKGLRYSAGEGRDPIGVGINQGGLGLVAIAEGKPKAAVQIFEETLRMIRRSVNSHWAETENIGRLALAWLRVGDMEKGKAAREAYATAESLALEAFAIAGGTGEQRGMVILRLTEAEAKTKLGSAAGDIREILEKARTLANTIGDGRLEARACFLMSRLPAPGAEKYLQQAMAIWEQTGGSRPDSPEAAVSYS